MAASFVQHHLSRRLTQRRTTSQQAAAAAGAASTAAGDEKVRTRDDTSAGDEARAAPRAGIVGAVRTVGCFERWAIKNFKSKLLPDAAAVALLRAHDDLVYVPLKTLMVRAVMRFSEMMKTMVPTRMLLYYSSNTVAVLALLTVVPFVAAVKATSPRRRIVAVAVAALHDTLNRLDDAVAATRDALRKEKEEEKQEEEEEQQQQQDEKNIKKDDDDSGNDDDDDNAVKTKQRKRRDAEEFGAFFDAMCDKIFGVVQLACVARRVVAVEAVEMIMSIDHFAMALGEGDWGRYTARQHLIGATQSAAWLMLIGTKLASHLVLAVVCVQDYYYCYVSAEKKKKKKKKKKKRAPALLMAKTNAEADEEAEEDQNIVIGGVGDGSGALRAHSSSSSPPSPSSVPAVADEEEGILARFAENFAVAVLIGSTTLGPLLAVPTFEQLSSSGCTATAAPRMVATFIACKACHLVAFGSLLVSIDMAMRSLRRKLVSRCC